MPQNVLETVPTIFPALRYRNAVAAVDWLVEAFGFEKLMVVPGPESTIAHAELRFGTGVIMLGSAAAGESATHDPNSSPETSEGLYVYVAGVEGHYERAKAAGAAIVRELQDTDYGAREYSARDIEGHVWSFGTYLPDLTGAAL